LAPGDSDVTLHCKKLSLNESRRKKSITYNFILFKLEMRDKAASSESRKSLLEKQIKLNNTSWVSTSQWPRSVGAAVWLFPDAENEVEIFW
jgi:hypothetical protein